MAFSMFLRTPACTNRIFSQQIMKLATQPMLCQRIAASSPALHTELLKDKNNENNFAIYHAVRNIQTSGPLQGLHHNEKPHDHAKLWVIEKLVSAVMVPLLPLSLLLPNKLFDSILALLISAHTYWGLEAIAVDYVRASVFGPIIPKIALGFVYLLCIATLGGLFYIITHDIGLANSIRQFWAIKSKKE